MKRQDIVIVDTETTGLDPDRHEIWEAAYICFWEDGSQHEEVQQFPINETVADPFALNIGKYWERRQNFLYKDLRSVSIRNRFCARFQRVTHGKHLVGAIPSFDEERIRRMMLREGYLPTWHYHLIDVEAMAAGYILGSSQEYGTPVSVDLPWDSQNLSDLVGADGVFEKHTALGDCQWVLAQLEAMGVFDDAVA